MKTPPRPTEPETDSNEDSPPASADPLRGVSSAAGGHISKDRKSTEVEFSRLKNLVPSISKKNTVSKLDVILEAIRYIDQLQGQLVEQIQEQRIHPTLVIPCGIKMNSAATGQAGQTSINDAQQETILSAIVVSSSTHWAGQPISSEERRGAFRALQDFSTQFEGRVPVALQWLQQPQLFAGNGAIDCTVPAQLYACEILSSCLNDKSKKYAQ